MLTPDDIDKMTPEEADKTSIELTARIRVIKHDIDMSDELGESPDGYLKDEIEFWDWRRRAIASLNLCQKSLFRAMERRGKTISKLRAYFDNTKNRLKKAHKKEMEAKDEAINLLKLEVERQRKKLEGRKIEIRNLQAGIDGLKEHIREMKRERSKLFNRINSMVLGGAQ